jgi:hypothetical protein
MKTVRAIVVKETYPMKNPRRHQMKVNIEVPSDLEATYSNFALITHSASEIIVDFARVLPKTPKAKVYARIITTPMHAKLLLRALRDNLEKYEAQFGEIKLPTEGDALAQQFFGAVKPPEPPES